MNNYENTDEPATSNQLKACFIVAAAAACFIGFRACKSLAKEESKEEAAIYQKLVETTHSLTRFQKRADTINVNNEVYVLADNGTVGLYVDDKSAVKVVNNLNMMLEDALELNKYDDPSEVYYPGPVKVPSFEHCSEYVDYLEGQLIVHRTQFGVAEGDFFNEDQITAAYRVMKLRP